MAAEHQNAVYVNMMVDTLKRKEKLLVTLLEQTRGQEKLLREEELDQEQFQSLLDEKAGRIEELNRLDDGFDTLFQTVKKEIQEHRIAYRTEIQQMQGYIARVADLGAEIQALEHQNSDRLKIYLSRQRKVIREFHVNNKTATNYYKNMANSHKPEQSYFFNETN